MLALIAAAAAHLVWLASIATTHGTAEFARRDFRAFRDAGMRVREGAFDALYMPPEVGFPFLHPPAVAVLCVPLGAVPVELAYATLVLSQCVALAAAVRATRRTAPGDTTGLDLVTLVTLASAPWLIALLLGQPSAAPLAIYLLGLGLLRRAPLTAGMVWSLAALKPPFLVPLVLFVISRGGRRAQLGMALGVLAIAALGLTLGLDVQRAWIEAMLRKMSETSLLWKQHTALALLRYALPAPAAIATYAAFAVPLGLLTWRQAHRAGPTLRALALLALGLVVLSPYLYDYDALILFIPLTHAWLERRHAPRWLSSARLTCAVLSVATQYAVFFARQSGAPLACLPVLVWWMVELAASMRNRPHRAGAVAGAGAE